MSNYIRDGRAPIPEKESISRVMSANKAKNTKPEMLLRKALWKANLRGYRLHLKDIPGRPDIAFPRKKEAIFVNGCYWHRCPYCNLKLPKSNPDFWKKKFARNVERDLEKKHQLEELGWKVTTIWECQIKQNIDSQIAQIKSQLHEP